MLLAVGVGALLAAAALVAVSCKTSNRLVAVGSVDRAADRPVSIAPAEINPLRDEPLIRVRIRRGVSDASLDRAGPWVVAVSRARVGEVVSGPARVVAAGGAIQIMDRSGRVTGFPRGATVFAAPHGAADGRGTVTVDGADFPGTLRLVPGADARTLDVVNVTDIEDYLPGVVSKELIQGWHDTAFRVQAVAARTFALQRREAARRTDRHFDVESTTTDQVYGGTTRLGVAHAAVEATRGVVLIDGAKLGQAYYSSTCGGRPGLPEEIWPAQASAGGTVALVAQSRAQVDGKVDRDVLCDNSPLYRWQVVRRTDELAQRISAWAIANRITAAASMRGLSEIRATEFGVSGRPIRFVVADRRGVRTELTGEQLRIACNFAASGLPEVPKQSRVNSNDMQFDVSESVVRIEGRGFGHGVGMCQFCTQGMAKRGDHWRDILRSFYPDCELRRVY